MSKIIKTEIKTHTEETVIGFVCDRCEQTIDNNTARTDSFEINYSCGYGTEYDGTSIEATICDKCLIDIVKKEIPKAVIKESDW